MKFVTIYNSKESNEHEKALLDVFKSPEKFYVKTSSEFGQYIKKT